MIITKDRESRNCGFTFLIIPELSRESLFIRKIRIMKGQPESKKKSERPRVDETNKYT
jgi:hypothetical protein